MASTQLTETEQQIQRAENALSLTRGQIDYGEAVRHYAMERVEGLTYNLLAMGTVPGFADEEWAELAAAAHDVVQKLTVLATREQSTLKDLREYHARHIRQEAERAARAVELGTPEEEPEFRDEGVFIGDQNGHRVHVRNR